MASLYLIVLGLLCLKLNMVTGFYQQFVDLPTCAQDCVIMAVNDSLVGCDDISLGCFCFSQDHMKEYDGCLGADSSCNQNPIESDAQYFATSVLCDRNVDPGFRLPVVEGNDTETVGLNFNTALATPPPGETLSTASSTTSSPTASGTSSSVSTTTTAASTGQLTSDTAPKTSTSVVVVEASSTTPAVPSMSSTGPAVATVTVTAAASTHFSGFGADLLVAWILSFTPNIFCWV